MMVLAGDSERKVWVTEFGWSTLNQAKGYEYGRDVTETDQGNYLVRAFNLGRDWGWIEGMFVWNLNFQQIVPAVDEKFPFGVVRPDRPQRGCDGHLRHCRRSRAGSPRLADSAGQSACRSPVRLRRAAQGQRRPSALNVLRAKSPSSALARSAGSNQATSSVSSWSGRGVPPTTLAPYTLLTYAAWSPLG